MKLKLDWDNPNTTHTYVKIYRGDAPLDRSALPPPIATLTEGEEFYVDTVVRGKTYYYVFETGNDFDKAISNNKEIVATIRRGPGSQVLQTGTGDLGYYGSLLSFQFINTPSLMNAVGLTKGTVLIQDPQWHKFSRKGKTLFVPEVLLVNNVSWMDLYDLGLVYGVNDTGRGDVRPDVGVNQLKTIKIGKDTYIVRLMTGYTDEADFIYPHVGEVLEPIDDPRNEWEDLIYPLCRWVPVKQKLRNILDLTPALMGLARQPYCQEYLTGGKTVIRGANRGDVRNSVTASNTVATNSVSVGYGWWPVLELVETPV